MPQYQDYFGQAALRPQLDLPRTLEQVYQAYMQKKQFDLAQQQQTQALQRQTAEDQLKYGFPLSALGAGGPSAPVSPENPWAAQIEAFMAKRKQAEGLEAQKTQAEIKKLEADAGGMKDFYDVPQAAAILGDPKKAEEMGAVFGGRIPRGAISPTAAVIGREATLAKPGVSDFAARGFADKARQAIGSLGKLIGAGFDPSAKSGAAADLMPNLFLSDNRQAYNQTKLQFVNAILRRESGAAIPDTEMEKYNKQYFPEPGDGPQTLAQKAEARELAARGLEQEAKKVPSSLGGPATEDIREVVGPNGEKKMAVFENGKFKRFK